MGQREVLQCLKENRNKKLTSAEIGKLIGQSRNLVARSIAKLLHTYNIKKGGVKTKGTRVIPLYYLPEVKNGSKRKTV